MKKHIYLIALSLIITSCNQNSTYNTYKDDLLALTKLTKIVELTSSDNQSRVCVCPEYQGRVITSTSNGLGGISNGWINRDKLKNKYEGNGSDLGGEDRVWIGPLGSQYSFYYQQIQPLSEKNWKVPACMNEEAYKILTSSENEISMEKTMELTNYLGNTLKINLKRNIKILEKDQIERNLQIQIPNQIKSVAYESSHTLKNTDSLKWNKEKGLAAIWSLGMFEGEDNCNTLISLPHNIKVKDINKYLGDIDSTRVYIHNNTLTFKTDGKWRSKIGIPAKCSPSLFACIKPQSKTLTIIQYQQTNDSLYFNSNPKIQNTPYDGEIIQVYNHGNMDYTTSNQNSFFELESTSAMKELAPNETIQHYHRVYHFTGEIQDLTRILSSLDINFHLPLQLLK